MSTVAFAAYGVDDANVPRGALDAQRLVLNRPVPGFEPRASVRRAGAVPNAAQRTRVGRPSSSTTASAPMAPRSTRRAFPRNSCSAGGERLPSRALAKRGACRRRARRRRTAASSREGVLQKGGPSERTSFERSHRRSRPAARALGEEAARTALSRAHTRESRLARSGIPSAIIAHRRCRGAASSRRVLQARDRHRLSAPPRAGRDGAGRRA